MNEGFSTPTPEIITSTIETFKAFVDAIIPITPILAQYLGKIQYPGALNLHTNQYLIWSLDHLISLSDGAAEYNVPLSISTAILLDMAANELISMGENKEPVDYHQFPMGGSFSALAPMDRLRAITLLEKYQIDYSILPIPFQNNPDNVNYIISFINRQTMLGYYSEWSGYGSTRLYPPTDRVLEDFPISWKQVSYPGPARGYDAFRGYLIDKFI